MELPLEFLIESDKLPIEAEPALEADEAKLSAPHGSDTTIPASSAQANRDAKRVIWTFRWAVAWLPMDGLRDRIGYAIPCATLCLTVSDLTDFCTYCTVCG